MQVNAKVIIVLVLLLAFLWGYKRDVVIGAFSGASTSSTESSPNTEPMVATTPAENPPPPSSDTVVANPFQPNGGQQGTVTGANPMGTPVGGVAPLATPPPNFANSVVPFPTSTVQKPSLAQTLDSIRPGEITQQMQEQRNAYIEKLAQQLRETQGGDPSATPIAIVPGAMPLATQSLMQAPPGTMATPFDAAPVMPLPEATPPHAQGMPMPPIEQVMPLDRSQINEDPDDDEDDSDSDDEDDDEEDNDDEEETVNTAM